MDWSRIPSLAALRAFEAVARLRSLTAAAAELNVTHAALSQHVRALERHFGEPLARREGQGMALTESGAALAAALSDGFDTIAAGVDALSARAADRPVRVSLTPAFAESWLMPRLGDFWGRHPEVELALLPSAGLVDLRRDGIDLAIRFGEGEWPGVRSQPLLMAPFAVVASPGLFATRRPHSIDELTGYTWYTSRAASEQRNWGGALGLDFSTMDSRELSNNGMALSAVRAGYGLSIQPMALVEADLADGRLVSLFQGEHGGLGYHLILPTGVDEPPRQSRVGIFVNWLERTAATAQTVAPVAGRPPQEG
ncbi:hypothetical protein BV394_08835 [Brevirhabdus pacifica]|uniref:Uncharacterized protein n=1 Tax=Brevirhabdus pacifica TaxID=1267768 RepID=A0A1U7DIQ5_9RHOB|nr:LysR family transcriptional regulator [Brevirhabdus pacifica]APX89805.1 hypothetical protein BV394_08835 [Brevirhabdus pacifica]PJJ82985.1 LysR family glycine cleavage system transcriptional activator [Brevirhabdus pacifica]